MLLLLYWAHACLLRLLSQNILPYQSSSSSHLAFFFVLHTGLLLKSTCTPLGVSCQAFHYLLCFLPKGAAVTFRAYSFSSSVIHFSTELWLTSTLVYLKPSMALPSLQNGNLSLIFLMNDFSNSSFPAYIKSSTCSTTKSSRSSYLYDFYSRPPMVPFFHFMIAAWVFILRAPWFSHSFTGSWSHLIGAPTKP